MRYIRGASKQAVRNRFIVANSQHENISLKEHKKLTGLVFVKDDLIRKYELEGNVENIAEFILSNEFDKLILSTYGQAIICSVGSHLDKSSLYCRSHDELLDIIEEKRKESLT